MEFASVGAGSLDKEVSHPSILKIRVKTKVETSNLQTLMGSPKGASSVAITSLAQDSFESSTVIPRSPRGPFRCTRSKQKAIVDPIEREREKGKTSFLLLSYFLISYFFSSFLLPFVVYFLLSLIHWLSLCSTSAKPILRELEPFFW